MNKYYKQKYIKCSCGSEGLFLIKFADEDEIYLSVWQMGYCQNNKLRLWDKIRYIWQIVKTGKPFHDQLVLDKAACDEIVQFIKTLNDEK